MIFFVEKQTRPRRLAGLGTRTILRSNSNIVSGALYSGCRREQMHGSRMSAARGGELMHTSIAAVSQGFLVYQ